MVLQGHTAMSECMCVAAVICSVVLEVEVSKYLRALVNTQLDVFVSQYDQISPELTQLIFMSDLSDVPRSTIIQAYGNRPQCVCRSDDSDPNR